MSSYIANGIKLNARQYGALRSGLAGGQLGLLITRQVTGEALMRRDLVTRSGHRYFLADAGRAWLTAYDAAQAEEAGRPACPACRDLGHPCAYHGDDNTIGRDEARNEAEAEARKSMYVEPAPRAYGPGPIVLALVDYYLTEMRHSGKTIGRKTGFISAIREAVRSEARSQNLIMTDVEITAWWFDKLK